MSMPTSSLSFVSASARHLLKALPIIACDFARTTLLEPNARSRFHRLVHPPPIGASCSPFRPCHRCRQYIGN
ncbi:hypothetical protein ACLOJK_036663, partial [Asimina triloba]